MKISEGVEATRIPSKNDCSVLMPRLLDAEIQLRGKIIANSYYQEVSRFGLLPINSQAAGTLVASTLDLATMPRRKLDRPARSS
jgi:hypothetical protein